LQETRLTAQERTKECDERRKFEDQQEEEAAAENDRLKISCSLAGGDEKDAEKLLESMLPTSFATTKYSNPHEKSKAKAGSSRNSTLTVDGGVDAGAPAADVPFDDSDDETDAEKMALAKIAPTSHEAKMKFGQKPVGKFEIKKQIQINSNVCRCPPSPSTIRARVWHLAGMTTVCVCMSLPAWILVCGGAVRRRRWKGWIVLKWSHTGLTVQLYHHSAGLQLQR
jgi:hypothetical protein